MIPNETDRIEHQKELEEQIRLRGYSSPCQAAVLSAIRSYAHDWILGNREAMEICPKLRNTWMQKIARETDEPNACVAMADIYPKFIRCINWEGTTTVPDLKDNNEERALMSATALADIAKKMKSCQNNSSVPSTARAVCKTIETDATQMSQNQLFTAMFFYHCQKLGPASQSWQKTKAEINEVRTFLKSGQKKK